MPHEFHRTDIPIRTLASGAQLSIPVFRYEGLPGPRVYIQGNIHGPEIAGIGAIYELMQLLSEEEQIFGTITLVPSVNPVGLDTKINAQQVGYSDLNETEVGNFNRIYQLLTSDEAQTDDDPLALHKVELSSFVHQHRDAPFDEIERAFSAALGDVIQQIWEKRGITGMSYGLKLALTIQELSYDANILLDLHTAADAVRHLYTFEECLPDGLYLDLRNIILLEKRFGGVLDEAFLLPWFKLHQAFALAGIQLPWAQFQREAHTLELGSADVVDRASMRADAERIVNYLRSKGVLRGPAQVQGQFRACEARHYDRYNAPTGGLLLWHKAPGDEVKAGETLLTILRTYQVGTHDETEVPIHAWRDGFMVGRTDTHVVHEGMSLCNVMARLRSIEAPRSAE